jgi:hypothetical protein
MPPPGCVIGRRMRAAPHSNGIVPLEISRSSSYSGPSVRIQSILQLRGAFSLMLRHPASQLPEAHCCCCCRRRCFLTVLAVVARSSRIVR